MKLKRARFSIPARALSWTSAVLLASACATAPVKPKGPAVFFPPPPELPRIQFLTSFNGLKDVEEQTRFNRFVVGEKPNVRLDKPYGVAMFDGKIYVCDTNATVVVFDLKKKLFGELAGAVGPGKLVQPVNISVDAKIGVKYVSDPVRGQVVAYGRDDQYLRAYGEPGSWRPVDAVPFGDRLYVADYANRVVEVFDLASGEKVQQIGNSGDPANHLVGPTNLAFDRDGYLYVTDFGRFQILVFDRDGHFRRTIGEVGDSVGHFARPKGIALDRANRLYAVDASFSNVQIFNHDGRLLMFFGHGGEKPGDFTLPAKVAIDYDDVSYFREYLQPGFQPEYLILVTSQFGPRLVNVFAFGKQKGEHYPTDDEILRQLEERRKQELEQQKKGQ